MVLKFECIAALAFLIVEFYVSSLSTRLNIERGVQDIFDNPNCDSFIKSGCTDCDGLNAECVDPTCERCRCSFTNATFLSSNDKDGGCVKDRYLLFIFASSNSFLIERIGLKCIAPEWNNSRLTYYFNEKRTCNVTDSSQRWIWTPNNQLMHVNTLKCLQQGSFAFKGESGNDYFSLVLGECISTQTKQLWQCLGQNIVNFTSKTSKLYMYQSTKRNYIYGTDSDSYSQRLNWRRLPSNQSLCSKAFGCYEFLESTILVTDIRNCPGQCVVEKKVAVRHEVGANFCFVMWEKLRYLDDNEWKKLYFRDKIFNVYKRNNITFLLLNFTKATNNWAGLIVKLDFYCTWGKLTQVNTTNTKCIVIKFNGTSSGPPTVPPTVSTASVTEKNLTSTSIYFTNTTLNTTGQVEKYRNDSWKVTIIVVCVVIVILILCGILGFIFYKRRRHSATQQPGDEARYQDPQIDVSMNPIYSPVVVGDNPTSFFSGDEATYQEPQTGASRECELYQPGKNNVYECTDVEQQNGKRPQLEHAYDYAKSDDVSPVAQRLPAGDQSYDYSRDAHSGNVSSSPVESKGKVFIGNKERGYDQNPVYQTLEDT